ncbi:MAG: ABC transporter ATP-binding protein [Anaerolineales bacterium]|nr:ABC transporter ATP-binding protein [Anaerolineales bacterium]
MITINNLSKQYNKNIHALHSLNLEIGAGMFGLLGPNGAGKTTLMRILAGLIRPTGGTVHIFGQDITTGTGKRLVKSRLGYLPQELGLYPDLTGAEFLDYVAILKGVSNKKERQKQTAVLLETVRIQDAANRRIKTYSGGMKRRLGIAQALLGNPKLLIVDEPTVGLDPEERVRLRNLLADMAQQCIVILSTHIVEDISQSCNEVAVINQGRVIFRGSPRELIAQARGKTWLITTTGERPNHHLTLVSTLQLQGGIQYRVLGDPTAHANAQPIEPSLEDGYIWLMKQQS